MFGSRIFANTKCAGLPALAAVTFAFAAVGFISVACMASSSEHLAATSESRDVAAELDLSTTSAGVIRFQNLATCADLARGGARESALSPTISFQALRLEWKPKDRDLFVSGLRLTITSSKILGGSQSFSLTSEEIASLVGVQSGIISADEVNGNKVLTSNRPENRPGFPLCQLNVGALNLTSANPGAFKADVTIELIGMSLNSANGADRKSEKRTFKTTAQFTN